MLDLLNRLLLSLSQVIDANGSIILASLIGAIISVVAREERSIWGAITSFLSGCFAGFYLTKVATSYVNLPAEPLAAVLAIMGRDLVRHIIRVGRENPMSLFNIADRFKGGPTTKNEE